MKSYIIMYNEENISTQAVTEHEEYVSKLGTITARYPLIHGYCGTFSEEAVEEIKKSPLVLSVEEDQPVHIMKNDQCPKDGERTS